jgi:rRNA-processing protein FCF1
MFYKKQPTKDKEGEPFIRAFILRELERLTPRERVRLIERVLHLSRLELARADQTPEVQARQYALAELAQAFMIDHSLRDDKWSSDDWPE